MAKGGVSVGIDTKELEIFAKRTAQVQKLTPPTIAIALNEIGDSLLSLMTQQLAKDTGLSLEEVRGLFRIDRATRNDLEYEIHVSKKLLEGDADDIESGRTSKDFGKRRPGTLVIVVSQKDELVCMDCEALEAMGPMPVETAMEHLPVHPNCRCVIMPYVQKRRRLPVTMTSLTGTSMRKRGGVRRIDQDVTLRQLAQDIMNRTATTIKIQLT